MSSFFQKAACVKVLDGFHSNFFLLFSWNSCAASEKQFQLFTDEALLSVSEFSEVLKCPHRSMLCALPEWSWHSFLGPILSTANTHKDVISSSQLENYDAPLGIGFEQIVGYTSKGVQWTEPGGDSRAGYLILISLFRALSTKPSESLIVGMSWHFMHQRREHLHASLFCVTP